MDVQTKGWMDEQMDGWRALEMDEQLMVLHMRKEILEMTGIGVLWEWSGEKK